MGILPSNPPWPLTYFTATSSLEHVHVVLGSKPAKVGLIGSNKFERSTDDNAADSLATLSDFLLFFFYPFLETGSMSQEFRPAW